jgi:hypothetical protein
VSGHASPCCQPTYYNLEPICKKRNNVHINVTSRHVREPWLPCKSNKYYIFWVCVCSLSYPACKAHPPYYIVICGLSSYQQNLPLSWYDMNTYYFTMLWYPYHIEQHCTHIYYECVNITNQMHNSYNQFLFHSFLSALHVSNESSRSSSGARYSILYCSWVQSVQSPNDAFLRTYPGR